VAGISFNHTLFHAQSTKSKLQMHTAHQRHQTQTHAKEHKRGEEEMMESSWLVTDHLSESCCSEAEGPPTVRPPITYSRSSDAVNEQEASGTDILGRDVHVLDAGSYTSASLSGLPPVPVNGNSFHTQHQADFITLCLEQKKPLIFSHHNLKICSQKF